MHFTFIREGVLKSLVLNLISKVTGVSNKTILRSVKRVRPTVCQRMERFHQPLSTAQEAARVRAWRQLVKQPRHYFRRVLRIDAAKFWVKEELFGLIRVGLQIWNLWTSELLGREAKQSVWLTMQ